MDGVTLPCFHWVGARGSSEGTDVMHEGSVSRAYCPSTDHTPHHHHLVLGLTYKVWGNKLWKHLPIVRPCFSTVSV